MLAPALPPVARVPCPAPRRLPDRALTEAEIVTAWGSDRAGLRTCEARRHAAVSAIDAARGSR